MNRPARHGVRPTHEPHSHEDHGVSSNRLIAAAVANSGFAVVQILVGISIGSVVVLADASHQAVDAVGLLTALTAALFAARPASDTMSFGWGKSDALGGLVSGLLLAASIAWIVFESIGRLFDPSAVDGTGVIAIGLAAITVNGLSVIALSGRGHHSLSLRAARLHLLTDLAGSFVVLIAGLVLVGTDARWIDPAASLLLSAVVLRATVGVLRKAGRELLDRVPDGLSTAEVQQLLEEQPSVEQVHHVHLRSLGQRRASVSAHVILAGSPSLHDAQGQLAILNDALVASFGIEHSTLQLECHPCAADDC